jgi:DNA-3-methyladenine glycosylase I
MRQPEGPPLADTVATGTAAGPGTAAAGSPALAPGPDGRPRCPWATSTADYLAYHDEEWGRPVHGERELFERLTLEAFQSGLSWLTILRKRAAFRRAFAGFDAARVAAFGPDDVARLLGDAGIVRNRAKIAATVTNARAVVAARDAVPGGLDGLVWAHAPAHRPRPRHLADVPATTPESTALAKALRRHGFVFVGPTTAYATMQACGLVDDHLDGCWVPPLGP